MTGPLTAAALVDKLTARRAAADAEITDLRERIAKLTEALAAAERDRGRWADACEIVTALIAEEHPDQISGITQPVTPAYQQILAVFTDGAAPLRAKDICQALNTGTEARHTEGMRSKLKKLVARGILTEPSPGLFALTARTGE